MLLQGKNAIVTGARSGIGLATVHLFARNGCNCWAVVHRDDDKFLANIAQWQEEYNVWIKPIHIDLSESESIKAGMKQIMQEKLHIDVLVNAAGIVSPNRLFSMTKMEDIRKVMDVNFFSVIELTQLVCRSMMRQRKGSIVSMGRRYVPNGICCKQSSLDHCDQETCSRIRCSRYSSECCCSWSYANKDARRTRR